MGLFRDIGERVERFKRQAQDASEEAAEYECRACGESIYTDREECPNCGSDAVVRRNPGEEGSDDERDPSADANATADDNATADAKANTKADADRAEEG